MNKNENLGILIYENAQAMDIIGPWEVLSFWKNISPIPINMYLIAESNQSIKCVNEITLKPHLDFDNAPNLDYLMVPGGSGRLQEVKNDKILAFIKKQAIHCKYILSDCTGAFLLYHAGLLKNKSATTYWRALAELKSFPEVNVVEDRIVKSGNIWTAGGVSSGIDLALELIEDIAGTEVAGKVQLLLEYFPLHKIYCTLNTAAALSPYQPNHPSNESDMSEYIKKIMNSMENKVAI